MANFYNFFFRPKIFSVVSTRYQTSTTQPQFVSTTSWAAFSKHSGTIQEQWALSTRFCPPKDGPNVRTQPESAQQEKPRCQKCQKVDILPKSRITEKMITIKIITNIWYGATLAATHLKQKAPLLFFLFTMQGTKLKDLLGYARHPAPPALHAIAKVVQSKAKQVQKFRS